MIVINHEQSDQLLLSHLTAVCSHCTLTFCNGERSQELSREETDVLLSEVAES